MTFGEKLKKLRTENNLTQDALAEKIFVTRTAISKWETDRGFPNIESLKAIARLFGVTVDELLSGEELLALAEADSKQKEGRLRGLIYGLLDLSVAMLLFLPLFAARADGAVRIASLTTLDGVQPYLKVSYFVVVICMMLMGILTLALQAYQGSAWQKSKIPLSLALSMALVLLFIISSQPYAAVFAFVLLAIKVLALMERK